VTIVCNKVVVVMIVVMDILDGIDNIHILNTIT